MPMPLHPYPAFLNAPSVFAQLPDISTRINHQSMRTSTNLGQCQYHGMILLPGSWIMCNTGCSWSSQAMEHLHNQWCVCCLCLQGWCVAAAQDIAQGQFVCQYVGEYVTATEARRRLAVYDQDPDRGHALLVSAASAVLRDGLGVSQRCAGAIAERGCHTWHKRGCAEAM